MSPTSIVTSCATALQSDTADDSTPCPTIAGSSARQALGVMVVCTDSERAEPAALAAAREPGAWRKAAPPLTTGLSAMMVM